MPSTEQTQRFLFTFRCNGEAHGEPLTEVLVDQLEDQDPSVAPNAYKRSWFGTEENLAGMLPQLGFAPRDVEGVLAALRDHRGAASTLEGRQDQLREAGFHELS